MQIGPGTRALVTGASRGIGREIAAALAARGATVGLLSRTPAEPPPGDHHVLTADVADADATHAAVQAFIERAGGLELVVANAGVAKYGPITHVGLDDVRRMTEINWLGTVHTVMAALPHLLSRAEGHVVVVSSGAGHRAFPWAAAYGATKAAQRAWADVLWHELSGTGVGVTTVFPGEYASELHAGEELMPDWYGKGGDPAELVQAILAGVEADRRHVFAPRIVRLLAAMHGLSPSLSDRLLRVVRGATAAPRRR